MGRLSHGPSAEDAHRVGSKRSLIRPAAAEFVKQVEAAADLRYFDGGPLRARRVRRRGCGSDRRDVFPMS